MIKLYQNLLFKSLISFVLITGFTTLLSAQHENQALTADTSSHNVKSPAPEQEGDHVASTVGHEDDHGGHGKFNPGATAFHHISDQNVYSVGPFNIPLPCILYNKETGWDFFSSSRFHFDKMGHGDGHSAYNKYVLHEGNVKRVIDPSFPSGEVQITGLTNKMEEVDGKRKEVSYVNYNGHEYKLDKKSTADGGLFGGGVTSFYDFSLGKNATSMLIVCSLLGWLFISIAKSYKNNPGRAPKGVQNLIEPIIVFLRDEVAKPFIGAKWEKYFPFLLALFFFILGLNLFGQVPFLGGSNVTGNLSVTMVLALIAFVIVTISGNKHYWQHILWMPGVPAWVKTILTPVEILGVFIKPLTLMLRLFANITAGHITLVVFVGLIFIFGKSGESVGASLGTSIGSGLLSMFMMAIELLVAFIQAYVFTLLTASYLGAATEEHHHAEEHH